MNTRFVFISFGLLGAVASQASFTLFAAESTAGSNGANTSLYGGVQQYDFATTGGSATMGAGLAASTVHDPVGLRFTGKLHVGNRFGNTLGQGSVQSFDWTGGALSGGTTIATASNPAYQGFHGFSFAPNGDLFVTTLSNGTRWYRDSGSGFVDIGGTGSGATRDALVSPDGKYLYETTTGNTLVVHQIGASSLTNVMNMGISGASSMHQMTWHAGAIYLTAFNSSSIHKVDLDSAYLPSSNSMVMNSTGAIGIAFSPDGQEMFVSSHTGNLISRYLSNGSGGWNANGTIGTGHNMGYLATTPEPGTWAALGLGAMAMLRRRRK